MDDDSWAEENQDLKIILKNKENERRKKEGLMLLIRGILYCIIIVACLKKEERFLQFIKKKEQIQKAGKNIFKAQKASKKCIFLTKFLNSLIRCKMAQGFLNLLNAFDIISLYNLNYYLNE